MDHLIIEAAMSSCKAGHKLTGESKQTYERALEDMAFAIAKLELGDSPKIIVGRQLKFGPPLVRDTDPATAKTGAEGAAYAADNQRDMALKLFQEFPYQWFSYEEILSRKGFLRSVERRVRELVRAGLVQSRTREGTSSVEFRLVVDRVCRVHAEVFNKYKSCPVHGCNDWGEPIAGRSISMKVERGK